MNKINIQNIEKALGLAKKVLELKTKRELTKV